MLDDEGVLGRRKPIRRTTEERAAIVAETYEPGATVAGVAHRHGMSATRLSTWRSAAKRKALRPVASFADVVVTPETARAPHDGVEIIAGTVSIRLPKTTTPKRIAAVARHLAQRR
ncbi:transposase (plasmid) [Aquicoccus sp. G2-2]|uniref:transposase n=1 Tax=Aquicoccus sp. G2-2 TaxID=3092120 RepID=UPI00366FCB3F